MASNTPPSGPDPAPHDALQEDWEKQFGGLMQISNENLLTLGEHIRSEVSHVTTSSREVVDRLCIRGVFNLVFILQLDGTKMAIYVPACGRPTWATGGQGNLIRTKMWFNSQVQTLKYVGSHTQIPVPEVYRADPTANNEISAPYIAMSHPDGSMVKDLWYDESGSTPLETRRRRILEHLAHLMAQLHVQRFDKIGSLGPANDPEGPGPADDRVSSKIGPCFCSDYAADGLMTINFSDSFGSTKTWLESRRAPITETQGGSDILRNGCYKLLEKMLIMLPDQKSDFALALYNLGWNNLLAAEDGTITGLINWDCAQTTPDSLGCLSYPNWLLHNLDRPNGNPNLSGSELEGYRAYYLDQIKVALDGQGRADDSAYTANSRAAHNFRIAYLGPGAQVDLCQGFVEEAKKRLGSNGLTSGLRKTPLRILEDIGRDKLQSQDKSALLKGLRAIMGY